MLARSRNKFRSAVLIGTLSLLTASTLLWAQDQQSAQNPDTQTQYPAAPPAPQQAASDPDAPPDVYYAMEHQLGLHMQKTKAPVGVMVIDKIEKPSAN